MVAESIIGIVAAAFSLGIFIFKYYFSKHAAAKKQREAENEFAKEKMEDWFDGTKNSNDKIRKQKEAYEKLEK